MSVRERANRKDSRAKTPDQLRRAYPWIHEPERYPAAAAMPWPPAGPLAGTRLTGRGYLRAVDALVGAGLAPDASGHAAANCMAMSSADIQYRRPHPCLSRLRDTWIDPAGNMVYTPGGRERAAALLGLATDGIMPITQGNGI